MGRVYQKIGWGTTLVKKFLNKLLKAVKFLLFYFLHAIRAETVADNRVAMIPDVGVHLGPKALVVPDVFADGESSGDCL